MKNQFKESMLRISKAAGLDTKPEFIEKCAEYYKLLIEENRKYNLTSITDPDAAAEKHFIDALLLLPDLADYDLPRVVDVGSGAGFPGLPIKMYKPNMLLTMIDAANKKITFINHVIAKLNLDGAMAVHTRAEEHAAAFREKYDIVLSRAVAETRVLMELTLPLVRIGGRVVISKGPGVQEEIKAAQNAIKLLGGEVELVREFSLPESGDQRSAVRIAKLKPTPEKYPRRPGIPNKRPL